MMSTVGSKSVFTRTSFYWRNNNLQGICQHQSMPIYDVLVAWKSRWCKHIKYNHDINNLFATKSSSVSTRNSGKHFYVHWVHRVMISRYAIIYFRFTFYSTMIMSWFRMLYGRNEYDWWQNSKYPELFNSSEHIQYRNGSEPLYICQHYMSTFIALLKNIYVLTHSYVINIWTMYIHIAYLCFSYCFIIIVYALGAYHLHVLYNWFAIILTPMKPHVKGNSLLDHNYNTLPVSSMLVNNKGYEATHWIEARYITVAIEYLVINTHPVITYSYCDTQGRKTWGAEGSIAPPL